MQSEEMNARIHNLLSYGASLCLVLMFLDVTYELPVILWFIHFYKRILEVLFIHKFGLEKKKTNTMLFSNLCKYLI